MGASQSKTEESRTTPLDTFKHEMSNILEEEKTFPNDEEALLHVKKRMDELFPLMKQIGEPLENPQAAEAYRTERDLGNIEITKMASKQIGKIAVALEYKHCVKLMSSLGAWLNLKGSSDVDIGVIVENLNLKDGKHDETLLRQIGKKLAPLGYKYDHAFNQEDPTNRYFSFTTFVEVDGDDVEVEVKVRDGATSRSIIDLHDKLDNSLTDEQIEAYTYVKYILSETDKKAYGHFKKLLYESVFCGIDGAFLFPALTS